MLSLVGSVTISVPNKQSIHDCEGFLLPPREEGNNATTTTTTSARLAKPRYCRMECHKNDKNSTTLSNLQSKGITTMNERDENARTSALQIGDKVVLAEDTEDPLANVIFQGKIGLLAAEDELTTDGNNCYVTVQLLEGVGKHIRWKRSCLRSVDITASLDKFTLRKIFSYAAPGNPPAGIHFTVDNTTAGIRESNDHVENGLACDLGVRTLPNDRLCRVNKRWRQILLEDGANTNSIHQSTLRFGFDIMALNAATMSQTAKWFLQHRPSIQSLSYYCAETLPHVRGRESSTLIVTKMLQECDTTNLTACRLQKTGSLSTQTMECLIQVLMDQCPKLTNLEIGLNESTVGLLQQPPSSELYWNNLTCLHLHIGRVYPIASVGTLVSSMERLERLVLAADRPAAANTRFTMDNCMSIDSASLRYLDVSLLHAGMIVKCSCSILEEFHCKVLNSRYAFPSNGSLPILTRDQFIALKNGSYAALKDETNNKISLTMDPRRHQNGTLQVCAGALPFVGLDVPASCACTVDNFAATTHCDFAVYALTIIPWIRSCQEKCQIGP